MTNDYPWIIWVGFFAIFWIPAIFKGAEREGERRAEKRAQELIAEARETEPQPPA